MVRRQSATGAGVYTAATTRALDLSYLHTVSLKVSIYNQHTKCYHDIS